MQPASSLFQQYQTFQNSRTKPEDYVKRYSTDLGIEDAKSRVKSARTAIRATEDTIAAAPESVSGRTSGSLVTEAQRQRLTSNEITPLNEIMRTQSNAFQDANADLSTLGNELDKRVGYGMQADDTQATTLLTLYQAAAEAERQAEAKRQWEAQMAEQKRQFDEQQKASAAARAASSFSPTFGQVNVPAQVDPRAQEEQRYQAYLDKLKADREALARSFTGSGITVSGSNPNTPGLSVSGSDKNNILGRIVFK